MADEQNWLRLPVVAAGAEYLVQGYLMRRNILTYKAPQNNEGYDLICIHPDPRHRPRPSQKAQIRVQVKSRYATDCSRGFPVKESSINAFDFVIAVFLNIGNFYRGRDGRGGEKAPEFYTLPAAFVRRHLDTSSSWHKVILSGMKEEVAPYEGEGGFEQIANMLGIKRPRKG